MTDGDVNLFKPVVNIFFRWQMLELKFLAYMVFPHIISYHHLSFLRQFCLECKNIILQFGLLLANFATSFQIFQPFLSFKFPSILFYMYLSFGLLQKSWLTGGTFCSETDHPSAFTWVGLVNVIAWKNCLTS